MTALTPEQMRALADKRKAKAVAGRSDLFDPIDEWAIEAEAALRTAADQLEAARDIDRIACAIKASKDKHYGPSWDEFRNKPPTQADYGTARLIVAALNADTAPQEDRDDAR